MKGVNMESIVETYRIKLTRSKDIINDPVTKFGGNPVFLCEADWPKCEMCSQEMDFLGQIRLDSPIEFSKKYQIAYIFMCPGKFDKRNWLICTPK